MFSLGISRAGVGRSTQTWPALRRSARSTRTTLKGSSGYLGAPPGFIAETSERWIATYRARAGYSLSQTWMAYVTGGGATAAVKITATRVDLGVTRNTVHS